MESEDNNIVELCETYKCEHVNENDCDKECINITNGNTNNEYCTGCLNNNDNICTNSYYIEKCEDLLSSELCNEASGLIYINLNEDIENCIWVKSSSGDGDNDESTTCVNGDIIFNDCGQFIDENTCTDKNITLLNGTIKACGWEDTSDSHSCVIIHACLDYITEPECRNDYLKSSSFWDITAYSLSKVN
jgi:hypothetical protein